MRFYLYFLTYLSFVSSCTHINASNFLTDSIDEALHIVVGEEFLRICGYYDESSTSGCFRPDNQLCDKVRITWINGMLNLKRHVDMSLTEFSDAHGGHTIHYVHHATGGWTSDILHSIRVLNQYTSPTAHILAQLWKSLITEMGGPQAGGTIIHYAHSLGALNTLMAKALLSPEEQKVIHVITLGSPLMISESLGFGSVTNYISRRDGVSLINPVGYIKAWVLEDANVCWVGSSDGIPFVDHYLDSESYRGVVKKLGAEFIETYKNPIDSHSNQQFNYNH